MKTKKFLSALVACAMIFGTMIMPAYAETAEAQIGDVPFTTIEEAFATAVTGDTIVMLSDAYTGNNAKDCIKIEGKDITLDLNGKTLAQTITDPGLSVAAIAIRANAALTVKDSVGGGKISATATAIQLTGTLNLESGTIACDVEPTNADINASFCNPIWIYTSNSSDAPTFNMTGGSLELGATQETFDSPDALYIAVDISPVSNYANASISFSGGNVEGKLDVDAALQDKVTVTGGIFTDDVSAYIPDGVTISENADGTFKVGVLPDAEVSTLDTVSITDYSVYDLMGDKKLKEGNGDPITLSVAMEFVANDNAQEAAANAYADYTTDFYISFDGLTNGSFVADGCYLAGNYDPFGWVIIPLDGMPVQEGTYYPVITSVGFDFSYEDICTSVKDFMCGIYFSSDVIAANPDMKVSLNLGLSENFDSAVAADFITVGEPYTYEVAELIAPVGKPAYIRNIETTNAAGADRYQVILFSAIDSLSYKNVGFEITVEDVTRTETTNTVYIGYTAAGDRVIPSDFGTQCNYMFALPINFQKSFGDSSLTYFPFATTKTGETIWGTKKVIDKIYNNN